MKKMTFKKSAASLAVAAALGAVGTSVQAVNLTNDGIGQVVIFPYYTVNGGFDNYLNVTNTSGDTVAFKVRFRESYNSQDVRDFNVILSPYDVWTALITTSDDDSRATIRTKDTTCTSPALPELGDGWRGIDFTNIAYAQAATADNGPQGVDRTKEGYYEVIEMGVANSTSEGNAIAAAALHHGGSGFNTQTPTLSQVPSFGGGTVPGCSYFVPWDQQDMEDGLDAPENNLKANATLINVENGNAAGIDPTILANFVTDGDDIAYEPFDEFPDWDDADPAVSVVAIDDPAVAFGNLGIFPGDVIVEGQDSGTEAVTAVLNRASVVNEFLARDGGRSEWVVTFPTKRYHVDPELVNSPVAPFNELFTGSAGAARSCDDIRYTLYDREEFTFTPDDPTEIPPFSPLPPEIIIEEGRLALCYEVNTIAFHQGDEVIDDILASPLVLGIDTSSTGANGWMDLLLEYTVAASGAYPFTDDVSGMYGAQYGVYYGGLPAIGFMAKELQNGVVDANLRSYMMTWEHGYRRNIFSSGIN